MKGVLNCVMGIATFSNFTGDAETFPLCCLLYAPRLKAVVMKNYSCIKIISLQDRVIVSSSIAFGQFDPAQHWAYRIMKDLMKPFWAPIVSVGHCITMDHSSEAKAFWLPLFTLWEARLWLDIQWLVFSFPFTFVTIMPSRFFLWGKTLRQRIKLRNNVMMMVAILCTV